MKKEKLLQVTVITSLEAEEPMVALLGRIFQQSAAAYTNEETKITQVSVYCQKRGDWTAAKEKSIADGLQALAVEGLDIGARLHPDHRADLVFEQVLRAPIAGMNHAERAFLAMSLFARHTASQNTPELRIMSRLLSPERLLRARALGAAMRLGCDLSGRSPALLARSSRRSA